MSEQNIAGENEFEHPDANLYEFEDQVDRSGSSNRQKMIAWIVTAAIVGVIAIVGLIWIVSKRSATSGETETAKTEEESKSKTGREVKLEPDALAAAGIIIESVTQRPAIAKLYVTGTVDLNPEMTEMATPLVGGRIERVFYGVGDYVNKGAILATISSPQVAQLHGKMHEARTRYELAQRNLARVHRAENRVAVLQAKAKLDLADTTLKRTKRLIELGAGAGKDLATAEANYKTAKADYDFQSNISLNKEIQEAKADVETSHVDMTHIQDEMRALGVPYDADQPDDHSKNTSLVSLRAPLSGIVTDRKFNAGAGVEAAVPIFAVSNLSMVFVIANVPEANVRRLSIGSLAEISSPSLGTIDARVSYIAPALDETTRTALVRLEVPNSGGKLRAGMFAEVGFQTGTNEVTGEELVVPSGAVQRTGDKTVVFIPREGEAGVFDVREIEAGGETEGYTRILSGLRLGEKVATKGSFILKTQLEKGAEEE
jgi:cobalt-zinc-cadmium efflux system membrane fusion protein